MGDSLVLAEQMVQRIMYLKHYGRLKVVQDVVDQTSWNDSMGLASEVIKLV
jgi:hypothetical protein